jgi:hypothetical protein
MWQDLRNEKRRMLDIYELSTLNIFGTIFRVVTLGSYNAETA